MVTKLRATKDVHIYTTTYTTKGNKRSKMKLFKTCTFQMIIYSGVCGGHFTS